MYPVVRYVCSECKREFAHPILATRCENLDREIRHRRNKAIAFEDHWRTAGHDVWYERGGQKHAPIVDPEVYGPHDYGDHESTVNCAHGCKCWAGPSASGGPVNPFGACPSNPLDSIQIAARVAMKDKDNG